MISKVFDQRVPFYEFQTANGSVWLPLVTIKIMPEQGHPVAIPVMFDTGATSTTLRSDLAPLFGASTWTEGDQVECNTAGGQVNMYRFDARLEVLGKRLSCPVYLTDTLPPHPAYQGCLGREGIFEHFGFGFWEKDLQLLVTSHP